MLFSNEIPGTFDHQYFWKESISVLDSLIGDNKRGEKKSETNSLNWACLVICENFSRVSLDYLMGALRLKIDPKLNIYF